MRYGMKFWQRAGPKLDFFIISHFDYDHCRHAAGILKIVRESIGAITGDGMSGEVIPQYPWKDELRVVDRIRAGKTHETYTAREGKSREQRFHAYGWQLLFSRTMAIFTGHDLFADAGYELPNFQMLCVAANGYVAGNGDKFEAREQKTAEDNENDYSLAFLLRFGSFRFYTGGDLHGTLEKDAKTITGGMEVPLVRGLKKSLPKNIHACAVLTHHHGSKKSTLGDFLNYFNPRIAVLSGNARASKKLPAREAIDRLPPEKRTSCTPLMRHPRMSRHRLSA